MWQSLGTCRPAALITVEREIWEVLFDVATFEVHDIGARLATLSHKLKDLLQAPGYEHDRDWFGITGE
jgi:hypothetical protein